MAVIAYPGQLQNAQTGNADSTNTIRRNAGAEVNLRQIVLRIVSTIGATPTVTVNIMGSNDGTNFYNVAYSPLSAVAGNDWVKTAIVITTAVTGLYTLMPGQEWQYLKLVMTLNTNVTLTSDLL